MVNKDLTRPVKEFAIPVHTTLHQDQTVDEALNSLRRRKIDDKIIYFYVIDDEKRLKGIVSTRHLLLKDRQHNIKDIMGKSVIHLTEEQTLEEAMELLSHHQLLALPVVDIDQKLKGVIDVQLYMEESVEIADARHSHDVMQILNLHLELGKRKDPWKNYRVRMPWILCNMAGGMSCAVISYLFEAVLTKMILLAMFIPLILTLSESIAMQSMTQSLQLVKEPHLSWRKIWNRIFQEGKMVMLIAGTCSILVGLISLLWGGGKAPSFTIATSLFFAITISSSAGVTVPLFLHSRAFDPKVASGPVVLMVTDVVTTSLYLGLATWWLI